MFTRSDPIPQPLIRPVRLAPGQTTGIALPSSPPNEPEGVRFAIDMLESLGLHVRPARHLFDRTGYLAGDDSARASDLNALFADESVDAIFAGVEATERRGWQGAGTLAG